MRVYRPFSTLPSRESGETMHRLEQLGVKNKVVTGDNR